MEKIYVLSVIQAFLIREVISLLLRFTSFDLRFANPGEYDIFRFSKSPAGLLTWQVGQTPDLKSVGKCQNPHLRRTLPINFQQVACPPPSHFNPGANHWQVHLSSSITHQKEVERGEMGRSFQKREEVCWRSSNQYQTPDEHLPHSSQIFLQAEKHAFCSTVNKGLLTGKQIMRCYLLCIFFCLCDWVFFVLFCSLGKKQAIQASSKGAKKTKNKSQLHELVTDFILFSITALMLCTNKIRPKNEINFYTPISVSIFSILFFTHFLGANQENLLKNQDFLYLEIIPLFL